MNFIEVVLSKISKKSKPIKKQEKKVNENLKRKRIFLDQEDFDILTVLQRPEKKSVHSENSPIVDDYSYEESFQDSHIYNNVTFLCIISDKRVFPVPKLRVSFNESHLKVDELASSPCKKGLLHRDSCS